MYTLVIGNRNYSSWSLRAWLLLTWSGIPFKELRIPLFGDDHWRERVQRYSPAGRVPALVDGDLKIWDSMAILWHLQEKHAGNTELIGWPEDPAARAQARSVTAEMHSGFLAIRDELPQNLRKRIALDSAVLSQNCLNQIARADRLWCNARSLGSGDGGYLYGKRCIADAFYAPLALRFLTYGIELSETAAAYRDQIATDPAVAKWIAAASDEPESLAFIDERVPAADTPLVLG